MKKKLLMLLIASYPLLTMSQGLYPYNKMDQKLKSQTPDIETLLNMPPPSREYTITFPEQFTLTPSLRVTDLALARDINTLVIEINTKNLSEITAAVHDFDSTLTVIQRLNKFSDSIFQATVRLLFESEVMFNKVFNDSRQKDSLLTLQYKDSLEQLIFLRRNLEYNLNRLREESKKQNPFDLFRYRTIMTDLNKEIASLIAFLRSQRQLIAENRLLLYREAERIIQSKRSLSEANTVPSMLSSLSDAYIIPTINILAQRIVQDDKDGAVYGATLFLSAEQPAKDSTQKSDFKKNATYSVLQPEASKFGFRFNYQHSYFISDIHDNKKRLELQGQFNYLIKSLPLITTDSLGARKESGIGSAGFFHIKGGSELFFAKYFSTYFNLNYVHCIQNVATYRDYFLVQQDGLFFINMGFTGNLALTNEQNNIKIGLDCIINNGSIKKLYSSNDPLILSLRVTYIPNLGKTL